MEIEANYLFWADESGKHCGCEHSHSYPRVVEVLEN